MDYSRCSSIESSAKGNGPEATREGERKMMSSTEIQAGLSSILDRF